MSPRYGSLILLIAIASGVALGLAGCQDPSGGGLATPADSPAGPAAPPPMTRDLSVAVRARAWTGTRLSGTVLDSDHYRVFTTARSRMVTELLPGFMEAAYHNYLRLTGLSAPAKGEPMVLYMMGSRHEWAELTRNITGPQSEIYLSISAGGYCYRKVCVFWQMRGSATWSVAAHEGMHQFLAHRGGQQLPMWVEEGLATNAEGHQIDATNEVVTFHSIDNASRSNSLRTVLANGKWIPLADLLWMDGGDAVTGRPEATRAYYAQVWALLMFLRSQPDTRQGLERLLADADGHRLHEAIGMTAWDYRRLRMRGREYNRTLGPILFRHYISEDVAGLDERFRTYAESLVFQ